MTHLVVMLLVMIVFSDQFPIDDISFSELRDDANESEGHSDGFARTVADDPQADYSLVSPEGAQALFHHSQVIRSNTEVRTVEPENVVVFDRPPDFHQAQSTPSSSYTVSITNFCTWTSVSLKSFHLQPLAVTATSRSLVPYSRSPNPELEGSSNPVSDEVSMETSNLYV